ncbi:MAG: conjugal transfer protein [Pisciglobus halotolerans]|nr:conjugal transfer protein [Tetragenococcus koreensis]MDN6626928.1 conjugal transfer protein [Pisciglobus halotolerans]MDN6750852.1 conjugal transfer protein [Staphylococcus equorum]MDN6270568.1 conjugal transfer protein [Tetragenococcus koreensis]MDN6497320.1 conjugal transfer protein [Tetragenococcus koreensis]
MDDQTFFQKVKDILRKKKPKKKEKQKNRLPNKTTLVSRFLWGFIIILLALSIFFVIQSFSRNAKQARLNQEVESLQGDIKELKANSNATDNMDVFGRYFVEQYYRTKDVDSDDYEEALKPYLAQEMEIPDVKDLSGDKVPTSVQLWEKTTNGDRFTLAYLVNYNFEPMDGDSENGREIVYFDIAEDDQKYSVTSYPYTKALGKMTATGFDKETSKLEDEEETDTTSKGQVEDWLTDTFFPRYFESESLDDVRYMMKEPELLGNVQSFEDIESIKVYDENDGFIVKATVLVKDKQSNMESLQDYSLVLAKNSSQQFYVKDIKHSLGDG